MYSNFASSIKRSMLAALVAGACSALSAVPAMAQGGQGSIIGQLQAGQSPLVTAAAQRDFAQFVQFNVQTRSGTAPTEFPLDVNDVQDLKDAKLGHGFQVFTIDPKDMLQGRGDMRSMAKPTGEWRFVISLQGRPIGLATVERVDGRWEVTSYGGAGLAREVDAALAAHGNAARSNLRFIRIYQAMSDLMEVVSPSDARVRYAPLNSARQMLVAQQSNAKVGADSLMEQADLLEPLRASVKTNMEAFR
jgi:hypothetical protein